MLPLVVLGPLGGVLADRLDRRALMIGSDLLRAACMAALAAVTLTGAPVVLAPALAALSTAAGAAYPPCVVALVPRLVDDDDLPAANAARVTIMHVCIVAGPVLGAALLAARFAGPRVRRQRRDVPRRRRRRRRAAARQRCVAPPRPAAQHQPVLRSRRRVARAARLPGRAAARRRRGLASAVYGALTVLFVLLSERLGLGSAGYGYMIAAVGVGAVLSAGIAGRAAGSPRPRRALAAAVVVLGAPLPIASSGGCPACSSSHCWRGAGSLVSEVVGDTALQRSLDPAVFARVYGLVLPAAIAGIALGALLAPPCLALLGLDGTLVLIAAICVTYGAVVSSTIPGPSWATARASGDLTPSG